MTVMGGGGGGHGGHRGEQHDGHGVNNMIVIAAGWGRVGGQHNGLGVGVCVVCVGETTKRSWEEQLGGHGGTT